MTKLLSFALLLLVSSSQAFSQGYLDYKKLMDTTIVSSHLGYEKNIMVTVPFTWQKELNQSYPLIIIFDSQNSRSHNYILNTIDYITSNSQMPASIIISVDCSDNRYLETLHKASNDKGMALENEKFIFEELIPLAEKEFQASKFRILIGHSRYGYFTGSLLFSRLDELNAIISMSPFFSQKNVELSDSIELLNHMNLTSPKFYKFGIGNDYPLQFSRMDTALKSLKNPNVKVTGTLFKEADHYVTPGLTISSALYEIFEEYARIQGLYFTENSGDCDFVSSEVSSYYGQNLPLSLGNLNGKGWMLYNEGKFDKAIEAWHGLMKYYPNFSEGYLYIIQAELELERDTTRNIEKFKKSLKSSSIYSESEKMELLQELENGIK